MTTTPDRLCRRPARSLPGPQLVSLVGDCAGPYADSPNGWWTECGGALDVRSGVVYIPRNPLARNLLRREYPENGGP